jgi:hypothetical protein
VPEFLRKGKLNCGVYIIAFECLSKLFYSFFSVMTKTGRRQALALIAGMVRTDLKTFGCPAVSQAKKHGRVFKNKHQALNQGVRRFGKRSLLGR